VDVYAAEFATKYLDRSLMRITAIVLCAGGSMARRFRLMQHLIQVISSGFQEQTM